MKQRAIESDALEKKLAELMAIKAQLNVADEDEGKTSEQLKYEVRIEVPEEGLVPPFFFPNVPLLPLPYP